MKFSDAISEQDRIAALREVLEDVDAGLRDPHDADFEISEMLADAIADIDRWTEALVTPDFGDVLPEPVEPADAAEYTLEIIDQAFEPSYGGWTVQFKAVGAPRFSYQKSDPILEAYVLLEAAPENAPKLGSGSTGSALARYDAVSEAMLGGGTEGQILRGFTGAALVEVMPTTAGNAPRALPSDDLVAAACQRALRTHITSVKAEQARLAVTAMGESAVGRTLKVRG